MKSNFPHYVRDNIVGLDKVARMLEYIRRINDIPRDKVVFMSKDGPIIGNLSYQYTNMELAEYYINEV